MTFGSATRRCPRCASRISASTAWPPTCARPPATSGSKAPFSDRQSVQRPRSAAVALRSRSRSPTSRRRPRRSGRRPRGELLRLPGLTLIDDSYNSSRQRSAARRDGEVRDGECAKDRGARRDAGARRSRRGAARGLRRRRAAAGLDLLIAVGGAPARALAEGAIRAGMPEAAVATWRRARRLPISRCAEPALATSSW